jgi:hypothetical protein
MELCEATTMQADIVAGTEHNLDARKYYIHNICFKTCMKNRNVGHHKLQMSSTPIVAATLYKPGGTLLLARGNCVAQIIEGGDDNMGCWSYTRMAVHGNCVVSIITVYQPCNNRGMSKGKFMVHAQQGSLLQEKYLDNPKPNPCKYFRKDMMAFLKHLQTKCDDLIMIGHFNEDLGNDPAGMSKHCCKLVLSNFMKM